MKLCLKDFLFYYCCCSILLKNRHEPATRKICRKKKFFQQYSTFSSKYSNSVPLLRKKVTFPSLWTRENLTETEKN